MRKLYAVMFAVLTIPIQFFAYGFLLAGIPGYAEVRWFIYLPIMIAITTYIVYELLKES